MSARRVADIQCVACFQMIPEFPWLLVPVDVRSPMFRVLCLIPIFIISGYDDHEGHEVYERPRNLKANNIKPKNDLHY